MATQAEKKLLDAKGPFGGNVIKKSGQIYQAENTQKVRCLIRSTSWLAY